MPPLLRPLARRVEEVDAIVDGLLNRGPRRPATAVAPESGRVQRVAISLQPEGGALRVEVRIGEHSIGSTLHPQLPRPLQAAHARFLQGLRSGLGRDLAAAASSALAAEMAELGR